MITGTGMVSPTCFINQKIFFYNSSVVALSASVFLVAVLLLQTVCLPRPGYARIGNEEGRVEEGIVPPSATSQALNAVDDDEPRNPAAGSEGNNTLPPPIVPPPVRRSARIAASKIPRPKRKFFFPILLYKIMMRI